MTAPLQSPWTKRLRVGREPGQTGVRARRRRTEFELVETLVDESDVAAALDDIRAVLAELGIGPEDLTRELYTDAVAAQRR